MGTTFKEAIDIEHRKNVTNILNEWFRRGHRGRQKDISRPKCGHCMVGERVGGIRRGIPTALQETENDMQA